MKALIIHNGNGVDKEPQEALKKKLESLNDKVYIRTSRLDQLNDFFKDLSLTSEKVQLLAFLGLDDSEIEKAKAAIPQSETMFTLYIGLPLENQSPTFVHEHALCFKSWDVQNFIKFIHQ